VRALSFQQPFLEVDGRPGQDTLTIDVSPNATVERDVRYRWLR
jgi:hypothetical protein